MRSIMLKAEVTLADETVKPGEIIVLSEKSAQALVNEQKAVFVEEK